MFNFIKDILFPPECLFCRRADAWVCRYCFKKIKFNATPYCLGCKQINDYGEFCSNCQPNYYLEGIFIAGNYEDPILSQLIKKLKYQFLKTLSQPLGDFLNLYLQNQICLNPLLNRSPYLNPKLKISANKILVVPVPLHKKRYRWRGFNQAELLARVVATNFGWKLNLDLQRLIYKTPQVKLNERERRQNVEQAFVWKGQNLNGRQILLVDDVTTTGATLNDAGRALKAAGAEQVWGLVVAKG